MKHLLQQASGTGSGWVETGELQVFLTALLSLALSCRGSRPQQLNRLSLFYQARLLTLLGRKWGQGLAVLGIKSRRSYMFGELCPSKLFLILFCVFLFTYWSQG